jgi:putative DNA primase/helicase
MVKLAQTEPEVVISADAFDANPMLLNCANGSIDLRTGTLRPHDRRDLLSKLSPVAFDPAARSSLFETTLSRAVPDAAVRAFLQRAAGYTATGLTGEDVLLLLYGVSRAMKGTILDAIHAALGDYAVTCALDDLAEREHAGAATPHLMKLRGARMAGIYETGRALKLDAAVVKTLTGSDPITARWLHGNPVTFRPCATYWIATNHRPRVDHDDDAMFERMREVPFLTHLPKEERDRTVRPRLADPADGGPAVLRWLVEGALLWQREGLGLPPAVEAAGAAYRAAMDPLAGFLDACCELADDPAAWTKAAELRATYEAWCRESGAKPVGERAFTASLRGHGCETERRHAGRGWRGILLALGAGA